MAIPTTGAELVRFIVYCVSIGLFLLFGILAACGVGGIAMGILAVIFLATAVVCIKNQWF